MPRTLEDRFDEKYTPCPVRGCWMWEGSVSGNGYGQIGENYKVFSSHRISYELHVGPIPAGMFVLHKCDVKTCVNPEHLFLGTQADNVADMKNKGRCNKGEDRPQAKLTEANVIAIRADTRPQRKIAEEYEVDQALIWKVKHRKAWSHVP